MCIKLVVGGICRDILLQPVGIIVHHVICDSIAFFMHRMSGNWSLLIHPHAQLIFG